VTRSGGSPGPGTLGATASQTVGPFFHDALLREPQNVLAGPTTAGQRIRVEGHVYDGDGAPVPEALVEIWQANAHGRYNHPADRRPSPPDPAFSGFGRSGTDETGRYWFDTVKPGPVPYGGPYGGPDGGDRLQAPHILITILGRGLLNHLVTRLYFEDDDTSADPVLQRVPESRRKTLIARRAEGAGPGGAPVYRLDIVLQGGAETVSFDV
jgi:protocatechuate 3,4-dioxygenase, alpha subunit